MGHGHGTFLLLIFFKSSFQIRPRKFNREITHNQPFVDVGHPLHDCFPLREYAIKIPVVLLIIGVSVILSFLSLVMIKSSRKQKTKSLAESVATKSKSQ